MNRFTLLSISACAALVSPIVLRAAEAPAGTARISDEVVAKVDASVVAIQHEKAGGSGFIVSPDGYILSNGHVVLGHDEEDPTKPAESITVILNDERKFPARVIGFCMDPDVSLLKIEVGEPLRPVEFADSTKVEVGQSCFAVGTPMGLKRTFTSGILSNVDRTDLGTFTKVFQTDAAINPGNSGGALFDSNGRVLGINTYAQRTANNLGFTIPIHVANVLRDHFQTYGHFVRGDLPLMNTTELYDELRKAFHVDSGILISYVMENTPAWKAGVRSGDILVEVDGQPVSARTHAELLDFNWKFTIRKPGTELKMVVLRGAPGKTERVEIKATIEEDEPMPKMGLLAGELVEHRYEALGFGYQRLTRIYRLLGGLTDEPGVLITSVKDSDPAGKADLRRGDVVVKVAGEPTPDVETFQKVMEKHLSAQEKSIEFGMVRAQTPVKTALAPYYDLKGKTVALVTPEAGAEHLALLRRELLAMGATLQLATPTGGAVTLEAGRTEPVLGKVAELDGGKIDVLVLAGNGGAQSFWIDEAVLNLIRTVQKHDGVLAGVGTPALAFVAAVPELAEKKMTLPKQHSAEALKRKANYTGAEVETEGNLVTSTGRDRDTVRSFLRAVRRASISATPAAPAEKKK